MYFVVSAKANGMRYVALIFGPSDRSNPVAQGAPASCAKLRKNITTIGSKIDHTEEQRAYAMGREIRVFHVTRIVPVRCYGQQNICIAIHITFNKTI
jgi:hypothetical protein